MLNKRSTKSALLTSSIALLLCFSMLLGTTFAWFTDNVASAILTKLFPTKIVVNVLS